MAGYAVYPIGILTNSFMRKVIDKLVDQDTISFYMALGDGGTIPTENTATVNPTEDTTIPDSGKMYNEFTRMECGVTLGQTATANDTIILTANYTVPAAMNAKVLNEIAVYDDVNYGQLLFYGWPSTTRSRYNMSAYTLATDDVMTFKIYITPHTDSF